MPLPLIATAGLAVSKTLARRAAKRTIDGWTRAATGKSAPGMLGKKAPRLAAPVVAAAAAQEAVEDYTDIDIPEITPNSLAGAELYRRGKDLTTTPEGLEELYRRGKDLTTTPEGLEELYIRERGLNTTPAGLAGTFRGQQ